MKRPVLIGQVVSTYLYNRVKHEESDSTARFILDSLSPEQTAAVAEAILADPELFRLIDVKIPANFVTGYHLPDSVLTTERATSLRHASCAKRALLLVNTGNDEAQSLRELSSISTQLLLDTDVAETWVGIAAQHLPLTDEQLHWWKTALRGLQELSLCTLDDFADYVLHNTRGNPSLTRWARHYQPCAFPVIRPISIQYRRRSEDGNRNGNYPIIRPTRSMRVICKSRIPPMF